MSISTFQKLTIVSCVVLCVALLLPKMLLSRGKRDANNEGPAGHFPPMAHRTAVSEDQRRSGRQFSRAHNPEAIARAKGAGAGATGGKSNLAGQIIPIYGFGILLYILYILFKITSKGKTTKPPESRFSSTRSENTKRKITDFELMQLQERLNETKDMIERIISAAGVSSDSPVVAVDEEQKLLLQLQEITRVMQEGKLVDSIPAAPSHCDDQFIHSVFSDAGCGFTDPDDQFCCVQPSGESDETSRLSEEPVSGTGDTNTTADDISMCGQSQPETHTATGSDITPGPMAEHSGVRQRIKQ